MDDDPFDVFGDSEDEEPVDQADESIALGRKLVESANTKLAAQDEENIVHETPDGAAESTDSFVVDSITETLPWSKPLYLGPMMLVKELPFGGGRGYVAERDLPPGVLLLVEESILAWSHEQIGQKLNLVSVRHILEHPNANEIYKQLEHYHPTKKDVDEAPPDDDIRRQVHDMMDYLKGEAANDAAEIKRILSIAEVKSILNSDGTPVTENDVVRLLLGLRYNGLESGLYLHVAMLNHSDQPNCVKFLPTGDKPYSEVRTTRVIKAGTPLTISYLPSIVSHASQRWHLWEQHRFDIGSSPSIKMTELELVGQKIPPSSIIEMIEDCPTQRIELALAELNEMFDESKKNVRDNGVPETFEVCKALEQSALELYRQATEQLVNEWHLLTIPCLKLHIDCCELVQQDPSLASKHRTQLLCRMLDSALKLAPKERSYVGPDHFDLARTNLDIAQTLEELLSTAPKDLLKLSLDNLDSTNSCSLAAHRARREFERIKALYPHDTEDFLQKT